MNEGSDPPRRVERSRARSFTRDVAPALVWTALVFIAGGAPAPPGPEGTGIELDKLWHAVVFGVLQLLGQRALSFEFQALPPRALAWIAAALSTLAGGALELYQLSLPHRSADLADWLADGLGACVAALIGEFWRLRAFRGN